MLNIKRRSMAAYRANIRTVIHDNYEKYFHHTAAISMQSADSTRKMHIRCCLTSTEVYCWVLRSNRRDRAGVGLCKCRTFSFDVTLTVTVLHVAKLDLGFLLVLCKFLSMVVT